VIYVVRFVAGGLAVLLFSAAGECFEPETFGGLFGAAPSVAIATLSIAFAQAGGRGAAGDARWMLLGCVALFAYTTACIAVCRRRAIPVPIGAFGAWVVWLVAAVALHAVAT
jgi:Protein of unknown function (DUF3147)